VVLVREAVIFAGKPVVAFAVGVGKLRDVLVEARLQNCCARLSAAPKSVGHDDDTHVTNAGANKGLRSAYC
jgi:hypothetical protein